MVNFLTQLNKKHQFIKNTWTLISKKPIDHFNTKHQKLLKSPKILSSKILAKMNDYAWKNLIS